MLLAKGQQSTRFSWSSLLSMERICYAWVWHRADSFRLFCSHPTIAVLGELVDVLKNLFFVFKVVQMSVFIGWCMVFGEGVISLPGGNPWSLAAGLIFIVAGQALNISVFYRLGKLEFFMASSLVTLLHGVTNSHFVSSGTRNI
jgi:hypothetical protein